MTKRRKRADAAIDQVRTRASDALAHAIDVVEEAAGGARRRTRKGRKRIDRTTRQAERKLKHFWNRGRFRVKRLERKAGKRIDKAAKKARRGVKLDA